MEITFIQGGVKRKGIVVHCQNCNKEIITRKDQPSKYCSPACVYESRRERVEITCRQCGKVSEKTNSKLLNSKHGIYFCSRKCKDIAQRIGGIQEIMPPHYGTANGRNSLIERQDNPVCCGCGEDKRYLLCVHHIDGNKDNNVLENFEILCPTCHAKRHLYFDEKSNTWIYCTKYLTPRDKLNEV